MSLSLLAVQRCVAFEARLFSWLGNISVMSAKNFSSDLNVDLREMKQIQLARGQMENI
jgi:hypothetical protein